MPTTVTRAQLATLTSDPVLIRAFEDLFASQVSGTNATTLNAAATKELQDATVLTLSPNDTFNNERVVAQGQGIRLTDTGSNLVISTIYNIRSNGGYRVTFNLPADLDVNLPFSGTVMMSEAPSADLVNYASNAAAVAGGLNVGDLYRTGGAVMVVT